MCILITKPLGASFPSTEAIANSVNANPDGFALAYTCGGEIKTFKTMSAARFLREYKRLAASLDPVGTAMIIHARIATHGAKNLKNCHCWLSYPGTENEMAFAHNGILSVPARDGMTDSETFLRDWFEPSFNRGSWGIANQIIARRIGTSKFAFLTRYGEIRTFGQFINEDDGCKYSNASYARCGFARCADPRNWRRI